MQVVTHACDYHGEDEAPEAFITNFPLPGSKVRKDLCLQCGTTFLTALSMMYAGEELGAAYAATLEKLKDLPAGEVIHGLVTPEAPEGTLTAEAVKAEIAAKKTPTESAPRSGALKIKPEYQESYRNFKKAHGYPVQGRPNAAYVEQWIVSEGLNKSDVLV